jgi:hypothetical protein
MENKNRIENKNPVKRKVAKKIRAQPIEVHWTSFEVRTLPVGKQQEIADELMAYVQEPKKYTITGFIAQKRLSRAVWHDWCTRYPVIARAVDAAKMYLGAKRFDAAASKDGSEKLLQWAGQYDADALVYIKQLEDLKAREDEKPTAITINMADFSGGMLPHMIEPEEEVN